MLILHKRPVGWRHLSPEELQRKVARYQAWSDRMRTQGRHVASEKLAEEGGKVLTVDDGQFSVIDGPYSETKEVVGGCFVFRAADYNEALEPTRDCPFLEDGRVELRQTDPQGCGGE